MKKLIYVCIGLVVFILSACEQNETMLYDTDFNALNFKLKNDYGYGPDSLYVNFMFLSDESAKETVKVKVRLMGMPVSVDRYYKVEEIVDESTAESGVHYEGLQEQYLFPAGETETYFELHALRHTSMRDSTYRLQLKLKASADFTNGIEDEQSFVINITDNLLIAPPFWKKNYLHYYGGPYHWKKCKKYIEIAGVDGPDWHPDPYAAGDVYIKKTRIWFEENPTYDEEGNRLYFEYR